MALSYHCFCEQLLRTRTNTGICLYYRNLLTALMAEISYRFIETPIRKKGFKAFAFLPKKKRGNR